VVVDRSAVVIGAVAGGDDPAIGEQGKVGDAAHPLSQPVAGDRRFDDPVATAEAGVRFSVREQSQQHEAVAAAGAARVAEQDTASTEQCHRFSPVVAFPDFRLLHHRAPSSKTRVRGAVGFQHDHAEAVAAFRQVHGSGGGDAPVGPDRHGSSLVVSVAQRHGLDSIAAAEAHVRRAVGVVADDEEVSVSGGFRSTGDDDLAVWLKRHRSHFAVTARKVQGHLAAAAKAGVRLPVRQQPQDHRVPFLATREDDLAVGLDGNPFGPAFLVAFEQFHHPAATEARIQISGGRTRRRGEGQQEEGDQGDGETAQ
jgi:hypothetical protein